MHCSKNINWKMKWKRVGSNQRIHIYPYKCMCVLVCVCLCVCTGVCVRVCGQHNAHVENEIKCNKMP